MQRHKLASVHDLDAMRLRKKSHEAFSRFKLGDRVMERTCPGVGKVVELDKDEMVVWVKWYPRVWSHPNQEAPALPYSPLELVLEREVFARRKVSSSYPSLKELFRFIEEHPEVIKTVYAMLLVFSFGYLMGTVDPFGLTK